MNARNTIWQSLWIATLAGATSLTAVGCSGNSEAGDSAELPDEYGELAVALTATGGGGQSYRLTGATFEVSGLLSISLSPDPDDEFASVDLPVGGYDVELLDGWTMEHSTGVGSFEPINAVLDSANPMTVDIEELQVAQAVFRFRAGDDVIELGNGRLVVSIEVNQDEPQASTINCLGVQCDPSAGEVCCIAGGAVSCVPESACTSPDGVFACDDSADCASGGVCCIVDSGGGGGFPLPFPTTGPLFASGCELSCPAPSIQLCSAAVDDCPSGTTCSLDIGEALGGDVAELACQ